MGLKSERFELRIESALLDQIDDWRGNQPSPMTRAEALRRLVQTGLRSVPDHRLQLSPSERLIVLLLSEFAAGASGLDPVLVGAAVRGGHYWALEQRLNAHAAVVPDDPAAVDFVGRVLEMWSFLEEAVAAARVSQPVDQGANDAAPGDATFPGFHPLDEAGLLAIVRFMVERLGRFQFLAGRTLEASAPRAQIYARMLEVFEPLRGGLIGRLLTPSEATAVLRVGHTPTD